LTDLSNNVYSKITDLSSNVYTQLNSKQPTLTPLTGLLGIGSNISEINYNNITSNKPTNFQSDWNSTIINKPNLTVYAIKSTVDSSLNTINSTLATKENALTFTAPLTRTTNTIGINLSQYSTSGSDTNYVLKSGSTMTGALTVPNITLGSNGKINSYDDYHYIQISQPTNTLTIQEYGTISFNIGTTKSQKAYINSTGLTVSGVCSATTFSGSGASLSNIPYTALTGTPIIYTQTETNNLLATKQNTITAVTPLKKDVSNNISIDLSGYHVKSYVDGSLNTINSTLATKQNTITAVTPLKKDVSNNLTIDLSGYTLLLSIFYFP
jgi:hypothetical protein